MSGELTPDATGTYQSAGLTNGFPSWRRLDNNWALWRADSGYAILSEQLGILPTGDDPFWTYSGHMELPTWTMYPEHEVTGEPLVTF